MIRNSFFSAITALVLIGCFATTHNFKVRFNDIQGLRKNDKVFFDETAIGKVTGIEYTDSGNYLVSVAIEELRRRLEKIGKEEELKFVEQKMETISARL